jgi:hypothetical protein
MQLPVQHHVTHDNINLDGCDLLSEMSPFVFFFLVNGFIIKILSNPVKADKEALTVL